MRIASYRSVMVIPFADDYQVTEGQPAQLEVSNGLARFTGDVVLDVHPREVTQVRVMCKNRCVAAVLAQSHGLLRADRLAVPKGYEILANRMEQA